VRLSCCDIEARFNQIARVFFDWPGVGNASDPREESFKISGQWARASEITHPDAAPRTQNARKLRRSGALIGKSAERALAEHRVEARVRKIQAFGIAFGK